MQLSGRMLNLRSRASLCQFYGAIFFVSLIKIRLYITPFSEKIVNNKSMNVGHVFEKLQKTSIL